MKRIMCRKSIFIIGIVLIFLIIQCITNNVNAFPLEKPEEGTYFRWNTSVLGNVDVEEFIRIMDENLQDKNVYNSNNEIVNGSDMLATGMYFNMNNKKYIVVVKGDVNGNGTVTVTDLSILKQLYIGMKELNYENMKAADMNNDSQISITDISLLKMFLVGFDLPDEATDPDDDRPKLDGDIEIIKSTDKVSPELTITINWPDGTNLDGCTKKYSLDGGETYQEYTEPIIIDKNAYFIATYFDKDGNTIGESAILIENIDNIPPNDFDFTSAVTSSSIEIIASTGDTLKDYNGNLIQNEYTGVYKYLYKLDDGEWQENNVFTGLKADTEYKVYVKAVDYAGNEKEATNNGLVVRTESLLDPTEEGNRILVSYDITEPTSSNVTVTFSFENEEMINKYNIQYQVGNTEGEWVTGTRYIASQNCVIYARLIDNNSQTSSEYVTANVTNIDKLKPLEFTPTFEYNDIDDKTIIRVDTEDAPADDKNMCSGINYYTYYSIYQDGSIKVGNSSQVKENYQEYNGNLAADEGENPIIGFIVDAVDKAGNVRRSNTLYLKDAEISDTELGIGNFNEGPGNVTIQGADKSYNNPVIPVGFKAVETDDASWGPYLPGGWDNGLVIEDRVGNQFIWVPVPCEEGTSGVDAIDNLMLNNREIYTINVGELEILEDDIPLGIESEEADETGKYGYNYKAEIIEQIEEYQGFYIARYEAGRKDGILAVQKGLETVNMVTYNEARGMAESMYKNPYVISGLPTGVHWDLLASWVAQEYGMDYIISTGKSDGNISTNTFKFTGRYAEGPDFGSGEVRGPYKYGENITKEVDQEILLATGLVEKFKIKNAYDFYGNVWEYTTEHIIHNGVSGNNARGADYYWEGVGTTLKNSAGILYRGFVPDGDARNEGGFRPVLFLSEGDANVEGDFNRTIDGGKATYNNPIIPAGYEPLDTANAKWGDGTTSAVDWDKGLVIVDEAGNEFVWVPVDGNNVKYETWLDVYLRHDEVGASEIASALENLGFTEDTTVNNFGGFYIARYETSLDSEGNAQTKENQIVKTNISYNEAVELTDNFKTGITSKAGIITGKQWDTTLRWIANELGEEVVTTNSSSIGNYNSSIANTGEKSAKNIFDIAGNAWEITSETYEGKIVYRGGAATETGESAPVGYRGAYDKDFMDEGTSYRMVLYVKQDNYKPEDVQVPEDNPGYASSTETMITFESSTSNWTNSDVTVNMSTNTGLEIRYAVTPVSTNESGEWIVGNSVKVTENSIITAKLFDQNGTAKSTVVIYGVFNIDKTLPKEFTPTVTLEGNRVRIKHSTTDDESGIKHYYFFMDNGISIRDVSTETEVVSKTLPIGKHQIYVVAEDNAGNMRASSKITVEVSTSYLRDIAKPGDYVTAKISSDIYNYKEQVLQLKNINHSNAVIVFETKELDWEYVDVSDHNAGVIEYCIGRSKTSINTSWFYDLYNKAMITGGSGTSTDPYTVNFEWIIFTQFS